MKIAVLYYGELLVPKKESGQHNGGFQFYDCDYFFSLSDKTHVDGSCVTWDNSEIHEYLTGKYSNIKGIQISHHDRVLDNYKSWNIFIDKNILPLDKKSFENGCNAYDVNQFSNSLEINEKLNKRKKNSLEKKLLKINEKHRLVETEFLYKIPFSNKELNMHKKYIGYNMVVSYMDMEEEDYDLVVFCEINQKLPRIFFEKVANTFLLSDTIFFFPSTNYRIDSDFIVGSVENMETVSLLWENYRRYQFYNLDSLIGLLDTNSDNPFSVDNIHYYHILNNGLNGGYLANVDIKKLYA